jgi:hypothetical protein
LKGIHRISPVTTIDLGDLSAPEHPRPSRRPRHHHRWRDIGLAFTAVLCLVSLHSAPGDRPMVRMLWTSPFDRTMLAQVGRDMVHTLRVTDGGGEVITHDLATGEVRWTRPLTSAAPASWISVLPEPGLLLLPAENGTTVLDAATGTSLWETTADVAGQTAETLLLREGVAGGGESRIRLVRARDGATIWQRSVEDVQTLRVQVRAGRPALVAVDDGDLTLLRYDDGAVVSRIDLPREGAELPQLAFVGDQLLVTRYLDARVTVTAYRQDTLAESWRTEIPGWGSAEECGPVVCLTSGDGIAGLEPGSGARRWFAPDAHGMWPVLDGRLVKYENPRSAGEQPALTVLDAATGQQIGDRVAGQPAYSVTGDRRMIVLRPQGPATAPTSVYDMDPVTGHSALIGQVGYELLNEQYELAGRYLVRQSNGRLQVMTVG